MNNVEKNILFKAYPNAIELIEALSIKYDFNYIASQLQKSETNPVYFVNVDKTFFNNKIYCGTRKIKSMS